ncbi:hypothetical protein [Streptomyces sp. NPDC057966]|uniref:hypothetical protein n=1 Tax=Streptomyces sp. NPDC057966 TaxID=3346292 RepID=UPI0036E67ECC
MNPKTPVRSTQLSRQLQRAFRILGLVPTAEFDKLALAAMLGSPPAEAENVLEGLVDVTTCPTT